MINHSNLPIELYLIDNALKSINQFDVTSTRDYFRYIVIFATVYKQWVINK